MTRLTPLMWDALKAAHKHNGQLRRIHHPDTPGEPPLGPPPWPAAARTLHALVRRDLFKYRWDKNRDELDVEIWELTDKGREALDPPAKPRKDSMDSMRAKGPATTRVMQGNVWIEQRMPEPEKVPAHHLSASWRDEARERHEGAETPRQLAARLVSELRSREQRRAA